MPEETEVTAPKNYKLTTTLPAVKIPGYAQLLDLDVIVDRVEFLLASGQVVVDWAVAPASDDTIAEPKSIDASKALLPQTPPFVLDALQQFFDVALPKLMAGYLKSKEPPKPEEIPDAS